MEIRTREEYVLYQLDKANKELELEQKLSSKLTAELSNQTNRILELEKENARYREIINRFAEVRSETPDCDSYIYMSSIVWASDPDFNFLKSRLRTDDGNKELSVDE